MGKSKAMRQKVEAICNKRQFKSMERLSRLKGRSWLSYLPSKRGPRKRVHGAGALNEKDPRQERLGRGQGD